MRYYIICRGLYADSAPWILAETVDEAYARDEANTWKTTMVLSREEAMRVAEFREAVLAWEARNDQEYQREMAREDAEAVLEDAGEAAVEEIVGPGRADYPLEAVSGPVWPGGLVDVAGIPDAEDAASPRILTFAEFRGLPLEAFRSEEESWAAYVEYLRLESAWGRTVDDATGP